MAVDMSADRSAGLLEQLVATASPSGSEENAVQALVEWLACNGWEAGCDEAGNALGKKGTGEREILLLGHIDTVPGLIPVHRTQSHGSREAILFGRGTVDAKGPLCAMACAATLVDPPPGWRITLVGAVEEESTSAGARHILRRRMGGTAPAYCVIGEPSRWDRVTLGYKGKAWMRVMLRHPMSHSAGQDPLPAEVAIGLWHILEEYCREVNRDRPDREFERLSPALESFVTGSDGTHGTVTMEVSFRLSLSDRPQHLEAVLESRLRDCLASVSPASQLECVFRKGERATKASRSNSLVRAFLKGIRRQGGDPRFVLKSGTADMNVVAPHWPGTPIVAYGPGDSALDHTPQEHISLDEYHRSIAVLRTVLETLCKIPDHGVPHV